MMRKNQEREKKTKTTEEDESTGELKEQEIFNFNSFKYSVILR